VTRAVGRYEIKHGKRKAKNENDRGHLGELMVRFISSEK
jgi:hypothetical protein